MARSMPIKNIQIIVKFRPRVGTNCIQMYVRKDIKVIPEEYHQMRSML